MKKIDNIKITLNSTIKEALEVIDKGAMKIALVVDEDNKLIGTLTDGDIRRGLLKGMTLDSKIDTIVNKSPLTAKLTDDKEIILEKAIKHKIYQIPIVDDKGIVVGIEELEEIIKPKEKSNKVILMAGGLGLRLRPLTENIPKPMLKVGDKPILQTIIENFSKYGYRNFILCVNYKSHIIQNYFKDGKEFGVNIEYIEEKEKMGTAGPLSLLKEKPQEPFFVMNGDILTNINFEHLHDYHITNKAIATMAVREYHYQVPYGVIDFNENKIKAIKEKPSYKFFVSAGIYMLSPEAIDFIPKNKYFDMPTLFNKIIQTNKNAVMFPIREYWIDIGRLEEYKRANEEYFDVFNIE